MSPKKKGGKENESHPSNQISGAPAGGRMGKKKNGKKVRLCGSGGPTSGNRKATWGCGKRGFNRGNVNKIKHRRKTPKQKKTFQLKERGKKKKT